MLRVIDVSEFDKVDGILTDQMKDVYTVSSVVVLATLTGSTILALLLAAPVLLISLKVTRDALVLRFSRDSWRVVPRRLPSGQFHTFLSHNWARGQE